MRSNHVIELNANFSDSTRRFPNRTGRLNPVGSTASIVHLVHCFSTPVLLKWDLVYARGPFFLPGQVVVHRIGGHATDRGIQRTHSYTYTCSSEDYWSKNVSLYNLLWLMGSTPKNMSRGDSIKFITIQIN